MVTIKRRTKQQNNLTVNEIPPDQSLVITTNNLKKILENNADVKFKEFYVNNNRNLPVTLIYVDGLVNTSYISDYVLKPLVQKNRFCHVQSMDEVIQLIENGAIYFPSQLKTTDINKVLHEVFVGHSALVFDGCNTAILLDTKGFEKRAITEPTVETVTKGAKDAFVETLRINTATVRRKIKTPNLVIEEFVIGRQTLTLVAIIYI